MKFFPRRDLVEQLANMSSVFKTVLSEIGWDSNYAVPDTIAENKALFAEVSEVTRLHERYQDINLLFNTYRYLVQQFKGFFFFSKQILLLSVFLL